MMMTSIVFTESLARDAGRQAAMQARTHARTHAHTHDTHTHTHITHTHNIHTTHTHTHITYTHTHYTPHTHNTHTHTHTDTHTDTHPDTDTQTHTHIHSVSVIFLKVWFRPAITVKVNWALKINDLSFALQTKRLDISFPHNAKNTAKFFVCFFEADTTGCSVD